MILELSNPMHLPALVERGFAAESNLDGVRRAYQDPLFHSDLNAFVNYSEVTDWQVSNEVLSSLAATRKFSDKSKTAIWAVGPLNYKVTRIYHA
jgi:hypothetical protein